MVPPTRRSIIQCLGTGLATLGAGCSDSTTKGANEESTASGTGSPKTIGIQKADTTIENEDDRPHRVSIAFYGAYDAKIGPTTVDAEGSVTVLDALPVSDSPYDAYVETTLDGERSARGTLRVHPFEEVPLEVSIAPDLSIDVCRDDGTGTTYCLD